MTFWINRRVADVHGVHADLSMVLMCPWCDSGDDGRVRLESGVIKLDDVGGCWEFRREIRGAAGGTSEGHRCIEKLFVFIILKILGYNARARELAEGILWVKL